MSLSTLKFLPNYPKGVLGFKNNNDDIFHGIIPDGLLLVKFGSKTFYVKQADYEFNMPLLCICLHTKEIAACWKDNQWLYISTTIKDKDRGGDRDAEVERRAVIVKKFVFELLPLNIAYFKHFLEQLYAGSIIHEHIFSHIKELLF